MIMQLSTVLVHKLKLATEKDLNQSTNLLKTKKKQLYDQAKLVDKTIFNINFLKVDDGFNDDIQEPTEDEKLYRTNQSP
jgi:hypothetical protein